MENSRKKIITNAKETIKKNYFNVLIISLIFFVFNLPLIGFFDYGLISDNWKKSVVELENDYALGDKNNNISDDRKEDKVHDYENKTRLESINTFITQKIRYNSVSNVFRQFIEHRLIQDKTIWLVDSLILLGTMVLDIFLIVPIMIGAYRYFFKIRLNEETLKKEVFYYFKGRRYLCTIKNIFLRNVGLAIIFASFVVIFKFGYDINKEPLFVTTMAVVFSICFIVILIRFMMIPYIMADCEGNMTFRSICKTSLRITKKKGVSIFVFWLTFVGWKLLAAATWQIAGILFIIPFCELAMLEKYKAIRSEYDEKVDETINEIKMRKRNIFILVCALAIVIMLLFFISRMAKVRDNTNSLDVLKDTDKVKQEAIDNDSSTKEETKQKEKKEKKGNESNANESDVNKSNSNTNKNNVNESNKSNSNTNKNNVNDSNESNSNTNKNNVNDSNKNNSNTNKNNVKESNANECPYKYVK